MNKDFEILFETGVDEMSWDDTVSKACVYTQSVCKDMLGLKLG